MSKPPFDPFSLVPPIDRPWGVNFGGGLNSTALVVELLNRGHRPHWILFADTGSERPETYVSTQNLGRWLRDEHGLQLSVTRWWKQRESDGVSNSARDRKLAEFEHWLPPAPSWATPECPGEFETLEDYALRTGYMPSVAYGYAGCTTKAKRQPCERWRKANGFADTVYAIGFDAKEHKRVAKRRCQSTDGVGEEPWYPLYAWGIDREQCAKIVEAAGLPPVGKSACFFCPHNKAHEWQTLAKTHPTLFQRALALEQNAIDNGNASTFGLRRSQGYLRDLPLAGKVADEEGPPCECFEASES